MGCKVKIPTLSLGSRPPPLARNTVKTAMGILLGAITVLSACTHPHTSSPPSRTRNRIASRRPPDLPDPNHNCQETSRRTALLFLSLPADTALLSIPRRAAAFSIGISGPKEWLRDQKKKAARFVLAPIDASRESLRNAYRVFDLKSPVVDAAELRKLLNSVARDCVPQYRNSFVAFQASTGVEVCTFALIVKNAASLLDDGDPLKLEAETRLDNLIRSFSFLGGTIDASDLSVTSDREKLKIGLMQSISALDKFEQGIKDCLGV
ncbi:hypothetical protein IEQ34_012413 [Dendrobium chrysotoxum]|uniref:Uncharacterized protein n=1 Tax=Dendrobium chrysotoxum TaxID=161865 RepID=A0AAV7GCV4_DENCH|nr:hypothetical protein IEQ34_012413 [Dendrobium chrysotoxum]